MRAALPGIIRFTRHFSPYLREHRAIIAAAMMALIGQALLRLLEPWPLKFIIDRVVDDGDNAGRFTIDFLVNLDAVTFLSTICIALVVITGIRALFGYYATVGFALIGNRVLTQLREALFRHIQSLSLAFHDRARGGDLVMRMISDIGMVKEVAVTAVLPLFGNIIVLAGMVAVMFWMHWQLALVALAATPLMWFATLKRSHRIQQVSRRNRQREGDMAATASESIGSIKTVQALSLGENFAETFARANNKSLKEGVQAKRLAAGLERMVDVLIAIATALVLWFGAQLVMNHELTPGELLVFVFYLRRAFRPMREFAKYTARLAKASAAGERVLELLETSPGIRDSRMAGPAPHFRGDITFHDVEFGFGKDDRTLQNINLEIKAGEKVAIVGPSGSGKSTLASMLLRLYDPYQGKVCIDGQDIRDFTVVSLRAQIAVVLQDSLLFATSVRENITAGLTGITNRQIEDAARLANAHEFINRLPDGYETAVGERGVTLSNGQRQRIAIARAAIRKSAILILDEPTTGLDPANEKTVSEALEKLADGSTTLHITHRPELAARADRVVYIRNGRVVATGTHAELMSAQHDYAAMFGQEIPASGDMQHVIAR